VIEVVNLTRLVEDGDNSVTAAFKSSERVSLTPDEVLRKIKSQPKLKSPEFSKLRVEHLKDCLSKQEADDEILPHLTHTIP
jgi:hypothetical protein